MKRPSRHTTLEDALASPGAREVHDRLIAVASAPVPEIGKTWQSLSGQLQERPTSWSSRVNATLRRPAAAFIATIVMSTGTAYAAHVEPVRNGVDWFMGSIASVLRPPGNSGKGVIPTTGHERKASEDESDRGSEDSGESSAGNGTVEVRNDDDAATDDRDREGRSASSTSSEKDSKGQQREREDREDQSDDGAEPDVDSGWDEPDEDQEDDDSRGDRSSKQGDSGAGKGEDSDEVDDDLVEHED